MTRRTQTVRLTDYTTLQDVICNACSCHPPTIGQKNSCFYLDRLRTKRHAQDDEAEEEMMMTVLSCTC